MEENQTEYSPIPPQNNEPQQLLMDFFNALKVVLQHKKVHKIEWQNTEYYVLLDDGMLRLHKPDGKVYDWIVSEADMVGEDYMVLD